MARRLVDVRRGRARLPVQAHGHRAAAAVRPGAGGRAAIRGLADAGRAPRRPGAHGRHGPAVVHPQRRAVRRSLRSRRDAAGGRRPDHRSPALVAILRHGLPALARQVVHRGVRLGQRDDAADRVSPLPAALRGRPRRCGDRHDTSPRRGTPDGRARDDLPGGTRGGGADQPAAHPATGPLSPDLPARPRDPRRHRPPRRAAAAGTPDVTGRRRCRPPGRQRLRVGRRRPAGLPPGARADACVGGPGDGPQPPRGTGRPRGRQPLAGDRRPAGVAGARRGACRGLHGVRGRARRVGARRRPARLPRLCDDGAADSGESAGLRRLARGRTPAGRPHRAARAARMDATGHAPQAAAVPRQGRNGYRRMDAPATAHCGGAGGRGDTRRYTAIGCSRPLGNVATARYSSRNHGSSRSRPRNSGKNAGWCRITSGRRVR